MQSHVFLCDDYYYDCNFFFFKQHSFIINVLFSKKFTLITAVAIIPASSSPHSVENCYAFNVRCMKYFVNVFTISLHLSYATCVGRYRCMIRQLIKIFKKIKLNYNHICIILCHIKFVWVGIWL